MRLAGGGVEAVDLVRLDPVLLHGVVHRDFAVVHFLDLGHYKKTEIAARWRNISTFLVRVQSFIY